MVAVLNGVIQDLPDFGSNLGSLRKYDPKEVSITYGGISISDGIAPGTFIEINRNSPIYTKFVGTDGEVIRVRTNDRTGTIRVTYRQGSSTHPVLSAVAASDEITGVVAVPFALFDFNGSTTSISSQAWIREYPDIIYSDIEDIVTWTWDCRDVTPFLGGFQTSPR